MHHNSTTELNTALTKDHVVEGSCDFQVVILPVSAVICHHQLNVRTSTLITYAVSGCSLGVSGMLSV